MSFIHDEATRALKAGGLRTLFSKKAAVNSFEKYVPKAREGLKDAPKDDVYLSIDSAVGKELEKEGIGIQSVPGQPTYVLGKSSERLGILDGSYGVALPGKEEKFSKAWGGITGKLKKYGKVAKPDDLKIRTLPELHPSFVTDATVGPTVEKARAILEGYVPHMEPKNRLGFKRYVPVDYDYKKTLGSVMDNEMWNCEDGKKAMHEALDIMKKQSNDVRKKAVNKLKRDFEKDQKYFRKRNLAYGVLALGGSVAAEEFGGMAGFWPSMSSFLASGFGPRPADGPGHEYVESSNIATDLKPIAAAAIDVDGVMTPDEQAFVDSVASMDDASQHAVVNALVADGEINHDEANQTMFLADLPLSERSDVISKGNVSNFDIDNDNQNNKFERLVNKTPYNVYNGRYAINLDTNEQTINSDGLAQSDFLAQEKFDPSNIIKLTYKEATKDNFVKAVSDLSAKMSNNDIIYITLSGHGNIDHFAFNDGKGNNRNVENSNIMTYTDMDRVLDTVREGKMILTLGACNSEAALKVIEDGNVPRVVLGDCGYWFSDLKEGGNKGMGLEPSIYDLDKNRHVSVKEVLETAEKYSEEDGVFSDRGNISSGLYLGDIEVK